MLCRKQRRTASGELGIHDANTGAQDALFQGQGRITALAFASPGLRLFGIVNPSPETPGAANLALVEWSREGSSPWARHEPSPVKGITHFVSAAGRVIASASTGAGAFDLLDAESGRMLGSVPLQPPALAPDRRLVAVLESDAQAGRIISLDDGRTIARFDPQPSIIKAAFFNDDGSYLVCACETGLAIYDTVRAEKTCSARLLPGARVP